MSPGTDPVTGYVVITGSGIRLTGSVAFGDAAGGSFATALPLVAELEPQVILSQIASNPDWYTGLAIVNPGADSAEITVTAYDVSGGSLGYQVLALGPGHAISQLVTQYIPSLIALGSCSGYLQLTSDKPVASFAVYGSRNALSALPPQVLK